MGRCAADAVEHAMACGLDDLATLLGENLEEGRQANGESHQRAEQDARQPLAEWADQAEERHHDEKPSGDHRASPRAFAPVFRFHRR